MMQFAVIKEEAIAAPNTHSASLSAVPKNGFLLSVQTGTIHDTSMGGNSVSVHRSDRLADTIRFTTHDLPADST